MAERVGVYPGTFDPVTNGHLDIINRATRLVDKLIIGVAVNAGKGPLFSLEERTDLTRAAIDALPERGACNIEVRPFDNLLMHFAAECGAQTIIRGLPGRCRTSSMSSRWRA